MIPVAGTWRRLPVDGEDDKPIWQRWLLTAIFIVALLFGLWGLMTRFGTSNQPTGSGGSNRRVTELEQRIAILKRSDEISREANKSLQGELAEREEEISGLRADVAFYERFVGSAGPRRGLTIHTIELAPMTSSSGWRFNVTLTQNLNRGSISEGKLTLAIEGTEADKLKELSWDALRKQSNASPIDYSFKYFQRLEGEVVLPATFKPLRVKVFVQSKDGTRTEQSFNWAETQKK